ncbi:hypothetical protein L0665_07435 [Methanogenium marinum]|uniref:Uncharacterized protein n=1 Tax=Methanogenium marinum TaxID=348610 RepID=A0A9Q4KTQ0_9EURY|nr:hypothetical protein [Methanogenium marinum]MDE4908444.1 hypothetical protein [Methanogenium marinum]
MENSRIGMLIMALPLLILIVALIIALYNVGFDMDAATLPENPTGPLNETLTSLLQADRPLVTASGVESDLNAGTVTLKAIVENPTAYPMTVQYIEYWIPGESGELTASLAAPVTVPSGESAAVELSGPATPDTVIALKSGSAQGILSFEIEIMGIRISTEIPRAWEVEV